MTYRSLLDLRTRAWGVGATGRIPGGVLARPTGPVVHALSEYALSE
jgi:hypothetical protein